MKTTIHLRRKGYDPLFDFMKGICILCVIWLHTMPKAETGAVFWASQAVPLFLFMQVFHALKSGRIRFPDWGKLFRRIILPYLATLAVIMVMTSFLRGKFRFNLRAGPGAYYPFVYIQFAVLIPLFAWVARAFKGHFRTAMLVLTFLAAVACELAASWLHPPTILWIYLCARYVFIIGLAVFWLMAASGSLRGRSSFLSSASSSSGFSGTRISNVPRGSLTRPGTNATGSATSTRPSCAPSCLAPSTANRTNASRSS